MTTTRVEAAPGVTEPAAPARWIVPAVASGVFALAIALVVILTAEQHQGYTAWISATAVAVLITGVIIGSEGLVGAAIIPLLGAALLSGAGGDDPTLGRSLLIGCAYYAIAELGWEAITDRELGTRPPTIRYRRVEEVAMVLALALLIGLVAIGSASLAPDRTPITRGAAVAAGMVLLIGLGKRLRK